MIAQGLPQEQYEEIKGDMVAPGISARDYVEMCVDFKEIGLIDGRFIFTTPPHLKK